MPDRTYSVRRKMIPFDWLHTGLGEAKARRKAKELSLRETTATEVVGSDGAVAALYINGKEVS